MNERVDICVVGGGIVGLSCAAEMAQEGLSVRLIDKHYIGSSRENIGDMTREGGPPFLDDFVHYCMSAWHESTHLFAQKLGIMPTGSIQFALTDDDLKRFEKEQKQLNALDVPIHIISERSAMAEALGKVRIPSEVKAIRLINSDLTLETKQALDNLRQYAIKHNVRIWGSDTVKDFLVNNKGTIRGVRTSSGELCMADHTIICAGVHGSRLLAPLGLNLPMRPARCHVMEVTPNGTFPLPVMVQPTERGFLRCRATPKGRVLITYDGMLDQRQATLNKEPRAKTISWMKNRTGKLLPALKNAHVHDIHTITMAMTPDFTPYIGSYGSLGGMLLAVGMNGHSYKYAAGISHILKSIIHNEEPPINLDPMKPNRFAIEKRSAVDFYTILPTYVPWTDDMEEEEDEKENALQEKTEETKDENLEVTEEVSEASSKQLHEDLPKETSDEEIKDVEPEPDKEEIKDEKLEEEKTSEPSKEKEKEEIKDEKPNETAKESTTSIISEKGKKVEATFGTSAIK